MNTPSGSNTQNTLKRVLEKIAEIAEKSAGADYIYRGESKYHEKVSSNLYREYAADIEAESFDIAVVQEEILTEARGYTTHKMDDPEILTELQHYGGKTNLIDFTTNSFVALFFACNGNPDKPGRVILLGKESKAYNVIKPPRTITRVAAQKSIFVQAPSGVVEPDAVVCIPADLKGSILEYLRTHNDISTKTIYNDLQGFIENRSGHKSAYTEFYKGFTYQNRAKSTKNPTEKRQWYNTAIVHYTEAVGLNPEHVNAYIHRGVVHCEIGNWQRAFKDLNTAIKLNPQYAEAYYNRGFAHHKKGDLDLALQDYEKAIELNPEDPKAYINRSDVYLERDDDWERAFEDSNTAIALNSQDPKAYINRGIGYKRQADFDRALQDINKAIALAPENAAARQQRDEVRKNQIEWGISQFGG